MAAPNKAGLSRTNTERTGSGYLRTPFTARSALVYFGAQAILVGLEPRQACLAHRFVAEQAVSALTELRWETKLHSTEDTRRHGRAEGVFSREGIDERRHHLQRQGNQAPELRQASSTKRGARSKEQG
jgi:hypothetical protein